jgi:hypothetical protein
LRFREDILRGVRLFAIVFAAILVCVAAYRIVRAPSDVPLAAPDGSTASEAQPSPNPEPAPVSPGSAEVHPLVVPEPPPVGGAPVRTRVTRPQRDMGVPPPPPPVAAPVVHARRPPAPSGKEFEASGIVALPAAPVDESPEAKPLTPKQVVGYKSLIEANANRPVEPVAPAVSPAAADDSSETQAKGNRFFRAIGKIFRPGGKKDTEPTTLQPKQ